MGSTINYDFESVDFSAFAMLSYRKSTGLSSLRQAELYLLDIPHTQKEVAPIRSRPLRKRLLPFGRDPQERGCSHSVATPFYAGFLRDVATSRHSSNKFGSALGKNVAPIRSRRRKKTLLPFGRDVEKKRCSHSVATSTSATLLRVCLFEAINRSHLNLLEIYSAFMVIYFLLL